MSAQNQKPNENKTNTEFFNLCNPEQDLDFESRTTYNWSMILKIMADNRKDNKPFNRAMCLKIWSGIIDKEYHHKPNNSYLDTKRREFRELNILIDTQKKPIFTKLNMDKIKSL
jgi:hypothetical protein